MTFGRNDLLIDRATEMYRSVHISPDRPRKSMNKLKLTVVNTHPHF